MTILEIIDKQIEIILCLNLEPDSIVICDEMFEVLNNEFSNNHVKLTKEDGHESSEVRLDKYRGLPIKILYLDRITFSSGSGIVFPIQVTTKIEGFDKT